MHFTLNFFVLRKDLNFFQSWTNFPFLHSSKFPPSPLSFLSTPTHFSRGVEGQASKRLPPRITQQDTIIQGKSPHIDSGQHHLIQSKKETEEWANKSEIQQLYLLGISLNDQAISQDSLAGPVFATSLLVKPCEPCLLDTMGHMLLVSCMPLTSTVFPFLLLWSFPNS